MSAQRIIEALGLEERYRALIRNNIKMLVNSMGSAEKGQILVEKGKEMEDRGVPKILQGIRAMYEEIFSEDELQRMADWYCSDLGQKINRSNGEILIRCEKIMENSYAEVLKEMGMGLMETSEPNVSFKDLN